MSFDDLVLDAMFAGEETAKRPARDFPISAKTSDLTLALAGAAIFGGVDQEDLAKLKEEHDASLAQDEVAVAQQNHLAVQSRLAAVPFHPESMHELSCK